MWYSLRGAVCPRDHIESVLQGRKEIVRYQVCGGRPRHGEEPREHRAPSHDCQDSDQPPRRFRSMAAGVFGQPPGCEQPGQSEPHNMVGDGHGDDAGDSYRHRRKATTIACPADPPDHERPERKREVLVGEGRAPEQKHRVRHVDEAGGRSGPTRTCDALEDEVEVGAQQDTCNAYDQQARGEHAQAGELYDTGGQCTQSRVVTRCREQWVPCEQVTHADDRLGIAHMDVLVDEGESVGRAHYLHQVQSESEKDDEVNRSRVLTPRARTRNAMGTKISSTPSQNSIYVGTEVF